MKYAIPAVLIIFYSCSYAQNNEENAQLIGGPCEGCEAIFEFGNLKLDPVDTLPDFTDDGKKIKITGTIYQPDGKTPAKNVILYIYHTDEEGVYPTKGNETGWARRHGYLRGWIKTDSDGNYTFYTLKPGSYPSRTAPAHIHATVLEPDGKYYYIQDYHFSDDPLLSESERKPTAPRGGSNGLLSLKQKGTIYEGSRDIILGKHVPGYGIKK